MPIQLKISPRIIPNIASLYNDVNRVFLEYIDNSLDSAENFFDPSTNSYSKEIIIRVKKVNLGRKGKIIIKDNCSGINNLSKVVRSIGDSDKKAQAWTNGQFGYGIYSFIAVCGKLEIISKLIGESALYIPIDKNKFEAKNQEDVFFPDFKKVDFEENCGTKIILSEFDNHCWRQIDLSELYEEINTHFESILVRDRLKIYIESENNEIKRCKAFDYEDLEGDAYKEEINELQTVKGRKMPQLFKIELQNPIKIFLKLTKGRVINKPPVFIVKGRRIRAVKDIKVFRSKHKSDIWGHPNLTGFIDVGNFLDPTIARDDFRNNAHTRALFNKMMELEPLILEFIRDINKKSEERHYRELENYLNLILSKLAKQDLMNYRTEYITGKNVNLGSGGTGIGLEDNETGGKDRGDSKQKTGDGKEIGELEGHGIGKDNEIPGDIPSSERGDGPLPRESNNPYEDSIYKGDERKKSGFNVRIVERDPDINTLTNEPERSRLVENTIEIFKKHQDFNERVFVNRKGEQLITQRLITYLAGEIAVHYKDRFHSRNGQPEYGKYLFSDFAKFLYNFEDGLAGLADKNLADL
ncbi:MAG: ATP-binding protein [Bacteroidota bacterium]